MQEYTMAYIIIIIIIIIFFIIQEYTILCHSIRIFLKLLMPRCQKCCCYFQYLQPLATQKCCSVQYFQPLKAQNYCYIQYLQPLWKLRNAAIFSSSRINPVFFRYLELANGQNCCISGRLQPPLRLQEAFEAFSKLFLIPKIRVSF